MALEKFLEGMIDRQKELINVWENYQDQLLKKVNAKADSASTSLCGLVVGSNGVLLQHVARERALIIL